MMETVLKSAQIAGTHSKIRVLAERSVPNHSMDMPLNTPVLTEMNVIRIINGTYTGKRVLPIVSRQLIRSITMMVFVWQHAQPNGLGIRVKAIVSKILAWSHVAEAPKVTPVSRILAWAHAAEGG